MRIKFLAIFFSLLYPKIEYAEFPHLGTARKMDVMFNKIVLH